MATDRNLNSGIPRAKWLPFNLVQQGFAESDYIFWGPGQLTNFPDDYMEPIGFKEDQLMAIFRVIRMFAGNGGFAGSPPSPPVPPAGNLCAELGTRWILLGSRRFWTCKWSKRGRQNPSNPAPQQCDLCDAGFSYTYTKYMPYEVIRSVTPLDTPLHRTDEAFFGAHFFTEQDKTSGMGAYDSSYAGYDYHMIPRGGLPQCLAGPPEFGPYPRLLLNSGTAPLPFPTIFTDIDIFPDPNPQMCGQERVEYFSKGKINFYYGCDGFINLCRTTGFTRICAQVFVEQTASLSPDGIQPDDCGCGVEP